MYLDKYKMDGRVAVVTGGARGIGLEVCRALAEAGATVVIADLLADHAINSAEALASDGFAASAIGLDVTVPDAVTAAAADLVAIHGRVDVLVNSAGIARCSNAAAMSDADWREVIDVDLNGVYWCARAFGKHMIARRRGSIVNLGSMSGLVVNKPQPQAAYNAAKSGVHMLTKSLACEWAADNVRVNAIAPGYIATEMTKEGRENADWYPHWIEMTPMRRCGEPHEVASTALFLASDASSYFTGSVLSVDGGYTAW